MTARYHAPDAPKPGIAILLSLLALALMFADARLGVLAPVRQVLGGALYPVQAALAWPMQQVESFEGYFDDMETFAQRQQTVAHRPHPAGRRAGRHRAAAPGE